MKSIVTRLTGTSWLLLALAVIVLPAALTAVAPENRPPPVLVPVVINDGPGDQSNPQISGDWVAYTSDLRIRYFNFSTNTDAEIEPGDSARDWLSDISGSKIVFTRIFAGVKTAVMVFNAATPDVLGEINPAPGTNRGWPGIGGDTVAYMDYGLEPNGELVIYDLTTSLAVRITNDTLPDQSPQVSPDGSVVVWEHCNSSGNNCDIWQAVKQTDGSWSVSPTESSTNAEANPDTNGTLVVYDSFRGSHSDVFWRPVAGGTEVQLQLSAFEGNPSIAGDFIAFESRPVPGSPNDLYVYDTITNRLFQITNTPLVNEQLNDITLLPDGRLRVVWASDEDGGFSRNVKGATFRLRDPAPAQAIENLIALIISMGGQRDLIPLLNVAVRVLSDDNPRNDIFACPALNVFIWQVNFKAYMRVGQLTPDQARQLREAANAIRGSLGCR